MKEYVPGWFTPRREHGPLRLNGHFWPVAIAAAACGGLLFAGLLGSALAVKAQSPEENSSPPPAEQKSRKTYPVRNGSVTYTRSEESERKSTPDGEIETERVRMPSWSGDRRVLMEREIRTKKLADGTVEKEYILKNPDGADRLVPTEIIRERVKQSGEATTVEREVLKPDFAGHWVATRKERVTETGPEAARQSVKEVREPTLAGDWKTVERHITSEKSSQDGKESRSVRQLPDAYGRLADYEVRQERITTVGGKETREVSVRRRDFQDTHSPKFYLVEQTVSEQTKDADGKTTVKSTTESDLLAGGASRNVSSASPQVVEERSEEQATGPDGTTRTVVNVKERGVVDPRMRSSYQVVQETDRDGYVRQIFVPLR